MRILPVDRPSITPDALQSLGLYCLVSTGKFCWMFDFAEVAGQLMLVTPEAREHVDA